ncbi:DNA-directed RNA polymerase subunit alpha C-terminal domain-containing protein [Actinomadura macra]|uniref:DNA-directed RNA polymerase subunit alpha C-terminal domain-containing protein n=1 Tax=Actinomadura macra TaxID=46164 RepID=UPI0012F98865|nr:DNA-directed RNA polymerase subunit alpha C-terminal domain-containing protein [Actinomadura macra]
MAAQMNEAEHHPHPTGLTMQCPVSCLGLRTVADLVNLLATATRTALLDGTPSPAPEAPPDNDQHSTRCPISCLDLSTRITNALRIDPARPKTIGDLINMSRQQQLSKVHNIGQGHLNDIRTALITAGIDVRHTELA